MRGRSPWRRPWTGRPRRRRPTPAIRRGGWRGCGVCCVTCPAMDGPPKCPPRAARPDRPSHPAARLLRRRDRALLAAAGSAGSRWRAAAPLLRHLVRVVGLHRVAHQRSPCPLVCRRRPRRRADHGPSGQTWPDQAGSPASERRGGPGRLRRRAGKLATAPRAQRRLLPHRGQRTDQLQRRPSRL